MSEDTLQKSCIAFFRNEFERYGKGVIIPVPNEIAVKRKDVVICLGCSDTILVLNSRVIFCEFKVGYNNQQQIQIEFQKNVERLGFEYVVIKSLKSFKSLFQ